MGTNFQPIEVELGRSTRWGLHNLNQRGNTGGGNHPSKPMGPPPRGFPGRGTALGWIDDKLAGIRGRYKVGLTAWQEDTN